MMKFSIIPLTGLFLLCSAVQTDARIHARAVEEGCTLPQELAQGDVTSRLTRAYEFFEREADFTDFAREFDLAWSYGTRASLCEDILATPASATISCLAQDLGMTIGLDASKAMTILGLTFEVGVNLFFGENGQLACGPDVGMGAALEFVGFGVASGVSARPSWDDVAPQRPRVCVSAGWQYFVGLAGTMVFDPLILPRSTAIELLTDSLVIDASDGTLVIDFRDMVLGGVLLLSGVEGVTSVGIEASAGLELKNLVPLAGAVPPDISVTACAEGLIYCSEDCEGKNMA